LLYVSSCSVKNNIYATKPNEDSYFVSENCASFGVLDGVSRDAISGVYPNPSPAYDVANLICDIIVDELQSGISDIENAILKANCEVSEYNKTNNLKSFPAGAVGVFCTINNLNMKYSYIGDSVGFVLRNNLIFPFTHKQTTDVIENEENFSLEYIRSNICNNPDHIYGYGVINGSPAVKNFIVSGNLRLKQNDVVFISTDGCDNILTNATSNDLLNLSPEELIAKYCVGDNQDDRTLIKIQVK